MATILHSARGRISQSGTNGLSWHGIGDVGIRDSNRLGVGFYNLGGAYCSDTTKTLVTIGYARPVNQWVTAEPIDDGSIEVHSFDANGNPSDDIINDLDILIELLDEPA